MDTKMKKIVEFPPLHRGQLAIAKSEAQFKVLACGRRWGKSMLAKQLALDKAINYGQNVWLVYPTFTLSLPHWREFVKDIKDKPFVKYFSEKNKMIEFVSGGSLAIKSADKFHNLRGAGLDFVVLDEASYMSYDVWIEVVAPMLADSMVSPDGGQALLISTPRGRNWFWRMYQKGLDEKQPSWQSWSMPSYSNPYLSKSYIRQMKEEMPSHTYRQEILAEFIDDAGGVFNRISEVAVNDYVDLQNIPRDVGYYVGVDWGRKKDYTVFSVFNTNREQVYLVRLNQTAFDVQMSELKVVVDLFKPLKVLVESNHMGQTLYERASQELVGYKVKPVYMTNVTKREYIERLIIGMEKDELKLLRPQDKATEAQYAEFVNFELFATMGGSVTYRASKSGHDDTVIATALAYYELARKKFSTGHKFSYSQNKFY